MSETLKEQDLQSLDKQTLITLLIGANANVTFLQAQVEQLNKNISLLTEEVHNLRTQRFGRSTERNLTEDTSDGQLCFSFNEAEVTIDLNPEIHEPEMEEIHPKAYKRSRKKGQRKEDLKDLPHTVITHELTEEQLLAEFPDGKWKRLPDQVYERLEFHPASFEVKEHHVAVYAGSSGDHIVRADRPADLFRNSVATASLLAGIYNYKFVNSMPIQRLSDEFARYDVKIPSQTMCRWVIQGSEKYMKLLYDRLHEKLFSYHVIHADETPVEVVRDGRPAGSKSYMWVYRMASA